MPMIDLHSHILPGLDDGAGSLDEALELARSMVAGGVSVVAATPHVRSDYPTTPEQMEVGVRALGAALVEQSIPLQVVPGGELALDHLRFLSPEDLRRFSLGASGRYVLVETPYNGWPPELGEQLYTLRIAGLVPILAHPERNPEVQRRPSLLEPLLAGGTLVQLTAASVDGRLGKACGKTAAELVRRGLAHLIASDAHTPEIRAAGLQTARGVIGHTALADWLTITVPQAIVAGNALPTRPR